MSTDPGAPTPYPPLGWPYVPTAQPQRAPGTVVAAVTVVWTCLVITVLGSLVLFAFGMWVADLLASGFDFDTDPRWYLAGAEVVVLAWSTAAAFLAWGVLRRRRGARIGLIVSSVATVLVSVALIVTSQSPGSLGTLVGAVAVIVLLFVPSTNAWFRQDGTP